MKAIEMFKAIEYDLIRNDDDYIIYSKNMNEDVDKIVSFCIQLENVSVLYESETIQIVDVPSINTVLLKTIQSQINELRWK